MTRARLLLPILLALCPGLLGLGPCSASTPTAVVVAPPPGEKSFVADVKPVLDSRCVVCHSCYNAPCQLKLSSYEGADRGGTKALVYDSARLRSAEPTRLFLDAHSTPAWRDRGFHSVLESSVSGALNDSLLLGMLAAKRLNPTPRGEYRSEDVSLSCPSSPRELAQFVASKPDQGMPFGLPEVSESEYETLVGWVASGAAGPTPSEQQALTTPSEEATAEIAKWEAFLNQRDAKHAMTARYVYEHYFIAHLHFPAAGEREFYELVRSATPPGEAVSVLATVRPYDPVDVERFYYRFRRIHSTIVHKTHLVVQLDDARLQRIQKLFIEPAWPEHPHQEKLDTETGANPFLIYAQIPPRSRYAFLLDHSQYIIDSFTRGPVCKGQIAVNVIHDHFWVLFLDPDADETVRDPTFLVEQSDNLRLPVEQGSQERVLRTFSNRYRERYRRFFEAKSALYEELRPEGLALDAIWTGERPSDAPVLTVYRHFDSASVERGVLGDLPRTAWVIDYPQLERIYYALVAGFDVFGNVSHQVNVRRYMDYLRIEGELNFLRFMPVEKRTPMLHSWYLGDRAMENVKPNEPWAMHPTQVRFETDDPKRELFERVVGDYLPLEAGIRFDTINYSWDGKETPMPTSFEVEEDIRNGFRALTAPGTGFISHITDVAANVLYVRVMDLEGKDHVFTIVINRWHDNVNSMFSEADTLDPTKDSIDFIPGTIGSYPNYFLDVPGDELPELFDVLANFDGSPAYGRKLDRYGVSRDDPRFWEIYDWFQARFFEAQPVTAGLYDLNRYYPRVGEE